MVSGVFDLRTLFRNVSCRFCFFSLMAFRPFYRLGSQSASHTREVARRGFAMGATEGRISNGAGLRLLDIETPKPCRHRPDLAIAHRLAIDADDRQHKRACAGDESLL